MDSQHQTSNNHDNSQPFRGDYPFHAASTDQYNYLTPDNDNSFNNLWDTGRYTPDSQDPINAFNQAPQHWGHNPLQNPNYGAPNYSAIQRPFDQMYSKLPENPENAPAFGFHPQQNLPTSALESKPGPYIQVPPNSNSQFNYSDQRIYQGPSNQSQTISPQALQHYPTPNAQAATQKARQVSLKSFPHAKVMLEMNFLSDLFQSQSQSNQTVSGLALHGPLSSGSLHQAPINGQGWKAIAAKLPASSARRALLMRDAPELSTSSNSKKFQGSAFLSGSSVDIVATKGISSHVESRFT